MSSIQIRVSNSMEGLEAADWDALVGDGSPFLEHAWLRGLEETGCLEPEEGWMPQILTAWRDDSLVGAIPMYVKGHSRGEFVYDWSWANLASRIGVPYYPKMIAAVPFTPVTGQRLLVHPDLSEATRDRVFDNLLEGALTWAGQTDVTGLHFLFLPKWQADRLESHGMLIRLAYQYHWNNYDFETFDDYLGRFRAKRRNKIKREIRGLSEAGVTLDFKTGEDITPEDMRHIQRFYKDTCRKFGPWTSQYLKDPFFDHILKAFTHRTQLVLARDSDGHPVAGTFSLHKGDRLYGRYWGANEDVPFLHFNACYYAPIQRAIELGVKVYEPGQGGHHKFKRGFEPTLMYSAHWLAHPQLSQVLERHLAQERAAVREEVDHLMTKTPYKPITSP